jgi:hypothetical protein
VRRAAVPPGGGMGGGVVIAGLSCPRTATRGVASRHQGSSRRGIGGRPECPTLVVLDVEELPDAAACRPGRRPAPPPVPRRLAPGRGATPRAVAPRSREMGSGHGPRSLTHGGTSRLGPAPVRSRPRCSARSVPVGPPLTIRPGLAGRSSRARWPAQASDPLVRWGPPRASARVGNDAA